MMSFFVKILFSWIAQNRANVQMLFNFHVNHPDVSIAKKETDPCPPPYPEQPAYNPWTPPVWHEFRVHRWFHANFQIPVSPCCRG